MTSPNGSISVTGVLRPGRNHADQTSRHPSRHPNGLHTRGRNARDALMWRRGTMRAMRLSPPEARRRVASSRVAHLATATADGQPHVVAVTFAVDGDVIYTAVDHKPKTSTNSGGSATSPRTPRSACSPTTTPMTGPRSGGLAPTAAPRSSPTRTRPANRWPCWPRATRSTGPTRPTARSSPLAPAPGPPGPSPDRPLVVADSGHPPHAGGALTVRTSRSRRSGAGDQRYLRGTVITAISGRPGHPGRAERAAR
jgi:Pyridoxamine 5'-phosphate oxidase